MSGGKPDVQVIGSGPSALFLAVACVREGLRVRVLGGEDGGWPNNYGIWVDELQQVGLEDYLGARWADAEVVLGDGHVRRVGRAYGRIARRRLRAHLLETLEACGAQVEWTRAATVRHDPSGSVVLDERGEEWPSWVVADASGYQPVLAERSGRPTAFQAAYGVIGTMEGHPWTGDVATFMDWRPADDAARYEGSPSFLYAMPLPGSRVLVEETSLIGAPAVPFALLRERLKRRLMRMDLRIGAVEHTELCLIPMDMPLPLWGQRVLPFGAAAGMVHPATGFQLGRALRAAPRVAKVLARLRDGLPQVAVDCAWREVWSRSALASRELHLFGARLLTSLDQDATVSFFDAFFRIPEPLRRGYLRGDEGASTTMGAMLAVLGASSAELRGHVLQGSLGLPFRVLGASFGRQPGVGRA